MQSRIDGITQLADQIKNLLHQPVEYGDTRSLSHSDLSDWRYIVDLQALQPQSRRYTDYNRAGLLRRVGFALFRNTSLLEKTSRLQNHIEGLREFTQCTFRLKQHCDPNEKVTSAELHRISNLKIRFDQISKLAMILYHQGLFSRVHWEVELSPPEAEYTQELWPDVATVYSYIDFVVRDKSPNEEPKAIRIRVYFKELSDDQQVNLSRIVRRVNEIVLDSRRLECQSEYDEFFELLELPSRRSRALRQMLIEKTFSGKHRKCFEVERADLVYGLGHWMVLLSNTSWPVDLCTCRIHCIHTVDSCTRHSMLPRPVGLPFSSRCPHQTLRMDRFGLLGVALAEIALAVPISVTEQDSARYLIGDEITSRKRLSSILREKYGRNTITKAVSYCFEWNSTMIRRIGMGRDELKLYCQNVLLP